MENKNLVKNYLGIIVILLSSFALQDIQAQFSSDNANTSSLEVLNIINVTLGGDFPISGTYPASRTERVDQLITRIFTEYKAELLRTTPDEELLSTIKISIDEYAKRNIVLKRFTGEEIKIDLVKFRITGDFIFNPYLKNDDVIIFPPLDLDRNFIDITGAVNKEIKFQFIENERLSDAIIIAQGINPAYLNVDSAQISRLSYDGLNEEILNVKISDNPTLQRGDRIRILADRNEKKDFNVLVLGEVNRPGKIHISKNNTTIAEVINKAGGFTNEASLKFSEIIRNSNAFTTLQRKAFESRLNGTKLTPELERKLLNSKNHELLKMYRSADITLEDTLFFNIDNSLRALDGYSQIDLSNLIDSASFESNYIVKDQDVIVIPEKQYDVYVWGGVASIGYYKFESGKSIKDYIEEAGGLTEIAYGEGEVFLIKGKTREWINIDIGASENIEAGDFIYVKKDPPKSFDFYLERIGSIASIVGTVATIVLLVNQFSNK